MGMRKLLSVAIFLATPILVNAQAPAFTQVIVFGDSLSDDGNIAHRARNTVGFSYPSSNFNYSDYRFTDDTNSRGGSLPAPLALECSCERLSGSTESRPTIAFRENLVVGRRSAEPVLGRQLSASGPQSSIGFPSGSLNRAKRPFG